MNKIVKIKGKRAILLGALCAATALLLLPAAEAGVAAGVNSAPMAVATMLPAAHHFGGHGHWGNRSFWGHGGWGHHSLWGFGGWYGGPYYYGPYFGLTFGYDPWWYGGNYVYVPRERPSGPYSLIDTDVKPLKATVYVDGEAVGKADDFNGYPGKLAVKDGHHVLTFVCPGYQNYTVEIDCIPYQSYQVKYKMQKVSVAGLEKYEVIQTPPPQPPAREPSPDVQKNKEPIVAPHSPACGDLVLRVYPYEASIYVDGQFKHAAEFDREVKVSGLSCGTHKLEIVKPGFKTHVQEFSLEGGQDLFLKVSLEKEPVV